MNLLQSLWRRAPVSSSIALICILVYLAMLYSGAHFANPHHQALIAWGANFRPLTVSEQGWRLFTALFVHGGILHLTMNTIALLDVGYLLERKIGRRMLLVVFLLSGLGGGLCSLSFKPLSVGVGMSGAVMGMSGALLVWLLMPKLEKDEEIERLTQVRVLTMGLGLTLLVGLLLARIDNAAHVGGLLIGMLLGLMIYLLDRLQPGALQRWLAALILFGAGLLLVWQQLNTHQADEYRFRKPLPEIAAIIDHFSNPAVLFRRLAQAQAAQAESAAGAQDAAREEGQEAGAGAMPATPPQLRIPAQQIEQALQEGVHAWDRCYQLSQGWDKLQLQPEQSKLGSLIVAYCANRKRQYQLLRQQLRQGQGHERELQAVQALAAKQEQELRGKLGQELQTEWYIQEQQGMNMRGQRRPGF
ncbi:rhomboid family intramembrane serine protease [Massilia sp. W12]|uniref:rhomboid family intramembrane serine protease n=1 Tax=Massilia sp. W12 TaxID=3126507 RepID=UPI0030D3A4DA